MAELIIDILVAAPVFLLWLTIVSVLVRPFGIPLPFTPFSWTKHRSVIQSLTFSQYLIVGGVLYFGCGLFVVNVVSNYLGWKYRHGSSLTSGYLLRDVVGSIFAGILFSFFTFSGRPESGSK